MRRIYIFKLLTLLLSSIFIFFSANAMANSISFQPSEVGLIAPPGTDTVMYVKVIPKIQKKSIISSKIRVMSAPSTSKSSKSTFYKTWVSVPDNIEINGYPVLLPIKISIPNDAVGDIEMRIDLKLITNNKASLQKFSIPVNILVPGNKRSSEIVIDNFSVENSKAALGQPVSQLSFEVQNNGNSVADYRAEIFVKSKYFNWRRQIYKVPTPNKKLKPDTAALIRVNLPAILPSGDYIFEVWSKVNNKSLTPVVKKLKWDAPKQIDFLSSTGLLVSPALINTKLASGRQTVFPVVLQNWSVEDLDLDFQLETTKYLTDSQAGQTVSDDINMGEITVSPNSIKLKSGSTKTILVKVKVGNQKAVDNLNAFMSSLVISSRPLGDITVDKKSATVDILVERLGSKPDRRLKLENWNYSKIGNKYFLSYDISNTGSSNENSPISLSFRGDNLQVLQTVLVEGVDYLLPGEARSGSLQIDKNLAKSSISVEINSDNSDLLIGNFDFSLAAFEELLPLNIPK